MKHNIGDRWMPNSRESQYLVEQLILENSCISRAKALEDRARAAGKNVWRDLRAAAALTDKVTEALLKTVPADKLQWLARTMKEGHIRVDMPGPVRREGYVVVSDRDAAALTEGDAQRVRDVHPHRQRREHLRHPQGPAGLRGAERDQRRRHAERVRV